MLLARITGRDRYSEVALEQFEELHRLLYCKEMGLWHHGLAAGGLTPSFWARGMAFSFLGILQVLELTDRNDRRFGEVQGILKKMARRIRALQDGSGFWFWIVDDPASEWESSGTAWVGAAMERGMRLGFLDLSYRECADRAWMAVQSRVWQGYFPGHGCATTASKIAAYYGKKLLSPVGWTHFAFRAACERRRALGKAPN